MLSREPRTQRARRRGAHAEREARRECVGVAAYRGGYAGRPHCAGVRGRRNIDVARDCGRPGFGWNLHGKTASVQCALSYREVGGWHVRPRMIFDIFDHDPVKRASKVRLRGIDQGGTTDGDPGARTLSLAIRSCGSLNKINHFGISGYTPYLATGTHSVTTRSLPGSNERPGSLSMPSRQA